jgi:hypothetical protein
VTGASASAAARGAGRAVPTATQMSAVSSVDMNGVWVIT